MGINENKAAVQSAYESFGRGDIGGVLAVLADDVVWSAHVATDSPMRGVRKGHAEVGEFFATLADIEIDKFDVENMVAEGDVVVVTLAERYTVKASGKVHEGGLVHLFYFNGEGKVDRFDEYEDANDAWRP